MKDRIILKLYKDLLREASKFNSYYYKNYFDRKIKSQFRKHIAADAETSNQLIIKSEEMLAMLKRQTMVTNAFGDSKLVIECQDTQTKSET